MRRRKKKKCVIERERHLNTLHFTGIALKAHICRCVERQLNKVALGKVTNIIDFNSLLTSDGVEEGMFFMSSTMESLREFY